MPTVHTARTLSTTRTFRPWVWSTSSLAHLACAHTATHLRRQHPHYTTHHPDAPYHHQVYTRTNQARTREHTQYRRRPRPRHSCQFHESARDAGPQQV